MCRQLIESSTYASSTPLDAFRGDVLCLTVHSIGKGAELEINGRGTGFRRLEHPAVVATALPASYSSSALVVTALSTNANPESLTAYSSAGML